MLLVGCTAAQVSKQKLDAMFSVHQATLSSCSCPMESLSQGDRSSLSKRMGQSQSQESGAVRTGSCHYRRRRGKRRRISWTTLKEKKNPYHADMVADVRMRRRLRSQRRGVRRAGEYAHSVRRAVVQACVGCRVSRITPL